MPSRSNFSSSDPDGHRPASAPTAASRSLGPHEGRTPTEAPVARPPATAPSNSHATYSAGNDDPPGDPPPTENGSRQPSGYEDREPDACVQRPRRDSTTAPITLSLRVVRRPERVWLDIADGELAQRWIALLEDAGIELKPVTDLPHPDADPAQAERIVLTDADARHAEGGLDAPVGSTPDAWIGVSRREPARRRELAKALDLDACISAHSTAWAFLAAVRAIRVESFARTMVGQTLPGTPYLLRGILGRGGSAVVYDAMHSDLGSEVAIKLSVPDDNPAAGNAALLHEAQLLTRLGGFGVPIVHDFRRLPAGNCACVMERVLGESLQRVLRGGTLPFVAAVAITERLGEILERAHDEGIVHLDLKPGNVMLRPRACEGSRADEARTRGWSERVVLVDFGAANSVAGDEARGFTPAFAAPEQLAHEPCDARTDVYALGGLLDMMLTGELPRSHRPRADSEIPARWREATRAWIQRARASSPSERFADARMARAALIEALPGAPGLTPG